MYAPTTHRGFAPGSQPVLPLPRAGRALWNAPAPHREGPDAPQEGLIEDAAVLEEAAAGSPGRGPEARVLLAEGDERVRRAVAGLLKGEGYQVVVAADPGTLPGAIERERPDIVLVDADLPGLDTTEVLAAMRARSHPGRLIAMTASGVEAGQAAPEAFQVLRKPLATEELLRTVARAARNVQPGDDRLRGLGCADAGVRRPIVGEAPVMERLFASITRVAPLLTTVLITGETGTGKELVARAIHDLSNRAAKPFVPVHCAALPETLLESELFGHVRGSFTGAHATRQGLLEEANGGTLFLDEVSTLSPAIQVKLLRVLQEHTVQRIGSNKPIELDLRLVAASNVDLAAEVHAGRFREDLYYRLQVFPIRVPPLRERKADIPLLVDHFRRLFGEVNGFEPPAITAETALRMMEYDWPGNVRELENAVERMLVTHLGASVARFEVPGTEAEPARHLTERAGLEGWNLARLEREYILSTLEQLGGRRGVAAERLGIDRRTLSRKLQAYRMVEA